MQIATTIPSSTRLEVKIGSKKQELNRKGENHKRWRGEIIDNSVDFTYIKISQAWGGEQQVAVIPSPCHVVA